MPSLNSLRALAALAEHGSYAAAGRALNVSHGAVMQQVRALEERLGVALVTRDGRGVVLTGDGAELARALSEGFDTIRTAVGRLSGEEARRPVQVSMSPAFATRWLMPRLADFRQRHPGIALTLMPTSEIVEFRAGGLDLAIRYADHRNAPEDADAVLVADMVAVAAPELVAGRRIARPEDLADLPWLEELGTSEVADWMTRKGVTPRRPLAVSQMPGNLIMEAVARGDGVTYTALPFVEDKLRAGELLAFFPDPAFGIYHIRTAPGVSRPPVRTFIRWLRRQARRPDVTRA